MSEDVIKKEEGVSTESQSSVVSDVRAEKTNEEEILPIKPPLQVLEHKTINKRFGWWAAVVLLQSYAKKQVCFYLWQRKDDIWKRKQKFGIHSREDWEMIKKAVEGYVGELS